MQLPAAVNHPATYYGVKDKIQLTGLLSPSFNRAVAPERHLRCANKPCKSQCPDRDQNPIPPTREASLDDRIVTYTTNCTLTIPNWITTFGEETSAVSQLEKLDFFYYFPVE